MKKSNYQAFNPNSSDYKSRREAIQTEINSNKVNIDRSVFFKTEEEKQQLKAMKKAYKKSINSNEEQ